MKIIKRVVPILGLVVPRYLCAEREARTSRRRYTKWPVSSHTSTCSSASSYRLSAAERSRSACVGRILEVRTGARTDPASRVDAMNHDENVRRSRRQPSPRTGHASCHLARPRLSAGSLSRRLHCRSARSRRGRRAHRSALEAAIFWTVVASLAGALWRGSVTATGPPSPATSCRKTRSAPQSPSGVPRNRSSRPQVLQNNSGLSDSARNGQSRCRGSIGPCLAA